MANCITGSVNAYVPSGINPWNEDRVRHLYSRACSGASLDDITAGLAMSPVALVDKIVDDAIAVPEMETPSWSTNIENLFNPHAVELYSYWMEKGMSEGGLRSKMMLFWTNHFVTQTSILGYYGRSLWPYFSINWANSMGNFQTFTKLIGKSFPMLRYLDGYINNAANPNENYGRELLELFTLGEGNGYTEDDIVEAARALAGWRISYSTAEGAITDPYLYTPWVDNNDKTIFGVTGNFDFDDVHDLIFQERGTQVARFICGKLYSQFIYQEPDQTFVNALAEIFKVDWDIANVLRHLFKSEHFMSSDAMGTLIKDPVDSLMGIFRNIGVKEVTNSAGAALAHPSSAYHLGIYPYYSDQSLFNPPNVAGWQRHRNWISQSNFVNRKYWSEVMINRIYSPGWNQFLNSVVTLTNNSDNPLYISEMLLKHFLSVDVGLERTIQAEIIFKGDVPSNYFEDGTWDLAYPGVTSQLKALVTWIVQQPEWELQ